MTTNKFFFSLFFIAILSVTLPVKAQVKNHVAGDMLVKTYTPINELLATYTSNHSTTLRLKQHISKPFHIYLLEFDPSSFSEEKMLNLLRNDPRIEVAQYNHILEYRATTPNDPLFNNQWQYVNTGQSGGTAGADLDAELAWDITTGGTTALGDTIVVAIIDDGIDLNHPDIAPNLWVNHHEIPNDGIDNDNNGYIDDYKGWNAYLNSGNLSTGGQHGTPVAGIIGAKGNNGIGVTGINWDVQLMIIKGGGNEAQAIASYSYCYTQRKRYNETNGAEGAYIVATNSSWGVDGGQAADAPLWCGFYDTLGMQGILSCGATANNNVNVETHGDLPTTCPSDYLISITNVDDTDTKVPNAGYGSTSIDLGAFGAGTFTTNAGGSYGAFGGTSGATPHVAGTVALMYAVNCPSFASAAKQNPANTALLVKQYLLAGTDSLPSLNNITVTGGRLNMFKAVNGIVNNCDSSSCLPPYNLAFSNTIDVSSVLEWQTLSSASQVDIRYRITGSNEWTTLANTTSPYTLSGLTACTEYDMQIQSICGSDSSSWSSVSTLKTDGCCVPPSNLNYVNSNDSTTVTVKWDSVLIANNYTLRYKKSTDTDWTSSTETGTNFTATLEECTEYWFQVQTNCSTGNITEFSDTLIFTTSGCGACLDKVYCINKGNSTTAEWLQKVVFNDLINDSGNNNGYANFTNLSTDIRRGQTYNLSLTPGYSGNAYYEYFKVWIDYNHDGDFLDDGELAFDAGGTVTTTIDTTITIPSTTGLGSTKMRVAQQWNSAPPACSEGGFNYGEVEDYCVNILEEVDTTNISNINTLDFVLHPNPVQTELSIQFHKQGKWSYAIVDVNGRTLKKGKTTEQHISISTSDLPAGVYFVKLKHQGEQGMRKLIKWE